MSNYVILERYFGFFTVNVLNNLKLFLAETQIRNHLFLFLQGFDKNKLTCQFNGTNARILGTPAITATGDYLMTCKSVPVSYKAVSHQ